MIRLAIRTPSEHAEQVLAALLERAPAGLEQVDRERFTEYAVYGTGSVLADLGRGSGELAGAPIVVSEQDVPGDWAEHWKRFHRPAVIGDRLYVRPPWAPAPVRGALQDLVIEPGQAFGTGSHSTTRLSLELLLALPADGSFADLGCGSGILAIAAAKLGFGPVVAVDSDPLAVEATVANARRNAVALARVELADLRTDELSAANTVAANLTQPLLLRLAERFAGRASALIVSGLLDQQAGEVANAFAPLRMSRRLTREGWTALLLER